MNCLLCDEHMSSEKVAKDHPVVVETDCNKSIYVTNSVLEVEHHIKNESLIFCSLRLTPRMQDIMALVFTKMTSDDWFDDLGNEATPTYTFTASQVAKFFNFEDSRYNATLLEKPAERLASAKVGFHVEGGFDFIPLISRCYYRNGLLVIKPNGELRAAYLVKSGEKIDGYAQINNSIYVSLKTAYSKTLYECLCRFNNGHKLYPVSISKIMFYFGIIGEGGKILVKSYDTPAKFIYYVLKPAIRIVSEHPVLNKKLKFNIGEQGDLGFSINFNNPNNWIITYEYDWLDDNGLPLLTNKKLKEKELAKEELSLLMTKSKNEKLTLNELKKTGDLLTLLEKHEQANVVYDKYKSLKAELAIKKEMKEKQLDNLNQTENEMIDDWISKL